MKKTIFIVLLFAVASTLLMYCTKENFTSRNDAQKPDPFGGYNGNGNNNSVINPLNAGLDAHYSFDNTMKDASHNLADAKAFLINNTGQTYSPVFVANRKGKIKSAIKLNGLYQVGITGVPAHTKRSMSVWVKMNKENYSNESITPILYSTKGFYVSQKSNEYSVNADAMIGNTGLRISTGLLDNEWHHLVLTYDGFNYNVYVDNLLKGTKTMEGIEPAIFSNYLISGGSVLQNWQGCIDDLRFYHRVLSTTEVRDLFYIN